MPNGLVRYQQTGNFHFITFSCYRREPFLRSARGRELFERSLESMRRRYKFVVAGYVVMPEHVHLLVSEPESVLLSKAIQAVKLSVAVQSKRRPFWQARYYDFNVYSEHKRSEKIQYMHHNPVKRGVVGDPADWPWSSYLHYKSGERRTVEIASEWTAASSAAAKPMSQKRDMGHPTLERYKQMWATRPLSTCNPQNDDFYQSTAYVVGLDGEQLSEANSNGWQHANVWAAGKLIATYDSPNASYGQTTTLHYLIDDPLGTRRAQVDANGKLEGVYQSLPFGDGYFAYSNINTPYTPLIDPTENHFTGKEHDAESGNDYFGARYYNSATGRWLSPDWSAKVQPVPYAKLDNPQSLNLYSYVLNNPMSKIDPDGHCDSSAGATARTKCQEVKSLKTSDYGRGHIQSEETKARQPGKPDLTVYPDGANLPTVGYGHQVMKGDNLKMGDKIKPERAEAWFNANVASAEKDVTAAASKTNTQLSQGEYDALVDLAYNAAGSMTPAKSPKLMDAMGKSDYNGMSEQLRYTHDVNGNTEGGLGPRSDQRKQIFKGEEP